ncbi:MAG: hypothetical protein V3S08_07185, partial [Phycisphaerales bacterium]
MSRSRSVLVAIFVLLSCGIATQAVVAQDNRPSLPSESSVALPTIEEVEAQIKPLADAQEADDLTDEDTIRLQLLRAALASLQAAAKSRQLGLEYDAKETQAPLELQAIRAELARRPDAMTPQIPARASLADLDEALQSVQAEVDTARTRLRDIEVSLADRVENDDVIRERQAELRHDLQEIESQLGALPLPDESPALTAARISKLNSDREAMVQWVEVLTQERENLEARRELLPLRRDRWTRRVNQLTGLE